MSKKGHFSLWGLVTVQLIFAAAAFAQPSASYTIKGQTQGDTGRNMAGITVCARRIDSPDRSLPCVLSRTEGQFSIQLSAPGRYEMITSKQEDGYMPQALPFYRDSAASPPQVEVNDSRAMVTVFVALAPKNGALVIKAQDAKTHLPVENFHIVMCRTDLANACFGASSENTEGQYKIFVSHAPFKLKIFAEGYEPWMGLQGSAEMPVFVSPGETMEASVFLQRRADTFNQPLSESEKQAGVNLPLPAQLSPAEGEKLDHFPRKTRLVWAPVEGAVAYAVEVNYCEGKEDCVNPQPYGGKDNPPMTGIRQTSYEFNFVGAQPGRWRVWAIDKEGREGFKSPWRTFFYLR